MAKQDIIKRTIAEAMKALVREKRFEDISIFDICEQSGVSRRTFYRYFSDKYEVIEWIHYQDFLLKIKVPPKADLHYIIAASIALVLQDREYYLNALKYRGQNSLREYVARHLSIFHQQNFRSCFQSDEFYDLYMKHSIEMALDFFEAFLAANPEASEDEFQHAFRDFFYYPSKQFYELLGQEKTSNPSGSPYHTEEPSRMKNST